MDRIFHLDAGRKYFGAAQICSILDRMAATGFTALELYFLDNQGFRLALDDMELVTPYGVYDLEKTLGDGYCQEDKFPDGSNRYLTREEVDAILDYARRLGIEVIPALEMPGHMGAILRHYPELRYPGSGSSIDLRRPEAAAFAYALAEKYGAFFAQRGCRRFNFCADEFANDLGTMGFDRIYEDGTMAYFVTFANELSRRLIDLGLTPMAFNDGFYYHNDIQRYGAIDNRIQICYWCRGWNTYFPASIQTLESMGFRLINAHQHYYCGVGCDWEERISRLDDYRPDVFDGNQTAAEPQGVMLCLWSDRANANGQDDGAYAAKMICLAMDRVSRAWAKD